VDKALPEYKPVQGVSGSIKSVGSDTLNNLMTLWAEGFRKIYPNVTIEIEGKGSSTAPPALISGTATFGPMSRTMKQQEMDDFEKRTATNRSGCRRASTCLAVYVHKDNPIEGLSFKQVDAILLEDPQAGRRRGRHGLGPARPERQVSRRCRSASTGATSASGTYGYFKEHTLAKGDYKDSVKEQPGSSAWCRAWRAIWRDRLQRIGYKTADVRAVPLSEKGGKFIPAEPQHGLQREYPLSRFLYVYMNFKPGSELDPLRS